MEQTSSRIFFGTGGRPMMFMKVNGIEDDLILANHRVSRQRAIHVI
jgi:hypothetical protein